MGFEVFVQRHRNGDLAYMERAVLLDAFGRYLDVQEPKFWRADYDELNQCDIYVGLDERDPERVRSLMLSRPCADERLWESVYMIIGRQVGTVLYWDQQPGLVGHPESENHLPRDMVASLGGIVCVTSGRQILERIRSS